METQKSPMKTTVLLKGDYMGFHVSLGEKLQDRAQVCPFARPSQSLVTIPRPMGRPPAGVVLRNSRVIKRLGFGV